MKKIISDVLLTPLNVIDSQGGNILHGIKKSSVGYVQFGEVYFSEIDKGFIKGWKRHRNMTLNIVVPLGEIKFVMFDNRVSNNGIFQEITISKNNYLRLTVPPMIWMAFQGLSPGSSMLMNFADIEHDPDETDRVAIEKINYDWSITL